MTPSQSQDPKSVDVPALMAEIRARVAAEISAAPNGDKKPFKTYVPTQNREGQRRAGELIHSEELHFLNRNWDHVPRLNLDLITTHRRGPIGRWLVSTKKKWITTIWEMLLKDFFEREREFQMRVVQYLNQVSVYVDDRDGAGFWELVKKIDVDVAKALTRIERISDEQSGNARTLERGLMDTMHASLRQLNDRITQLQTLAEQSAGRLQTVESVAAGVERIVGRITRSGNTETSQTEEIRVDGEVPDQSYVMLENRYRGSEEEISGRLGWYPGVFSATPSAHLPVLEIGAGRGELQILFASAGVRSHGVDLDPAMVAAARERGAAVQYGDGLAALDGADDSSLGGVIAIQVVEHLTRQQLARLFDLCRRKVATGGRIVFETINPQSVMALSSNYFRDPTHVWPLHPDTLSFALTMAGLRVVEIRKLSPVPEGSLLKKIPVEEYMTPRWAHAVDTLNGNVDRLNDLLFGFQDYAIIAEVV